MVLLFANVTEGSECMGQAGAVRLRTVVISCAFIHVEAGGQVCVKHLSCESPTASKECRALAW